MEQGKMVQLTIEQRVFLFWSHKREAFVLLIEVIVFDFRNPLLGIPQKVSWGIKNDVKRQSKALFFLNFYATNWSVNDNFFELIHFLCPPCTFIKI